MNMHMLYAWYLTDELIFAMEDTNAGHTTQRPLVTMEAGARPDIEIQKV